MNITTQDMQLFADLSSKSYVKDKDEENKDILLNTVFQATVDWAEEVVTQLGEEWGHHGTKHVLIPNGSRFRKYSWRKIFLKDAPTHDIYFTVGFDVENEKILIYKLDYQWSGSSSFSSAQRKYCQKHIKEYGAGEDGYAWQEGTVENSKGFTDSLIKDTVAFIEKHTAIYKQIVDQVVRFKDGEIAKLYIEKGFVEPTEKEIEAERKKTVTPTKTKRSEKEVELQHLHESISLDLTNLLRDTYGDKNVKREASLGYRRIDIRLRQDNDITLFELKTGGTSTSCIRAAIGQLLEYSYYPNHETADKLVIVTPHKANSDDKEYIKRLRENFGIPLEYHFFDKENLELVKEV